MLATSVHTLPPVKGVLAEEWIISLPLVFGVSYVLIVAWALVVQGEWSDLGIHTH